MKHYLQKKKFYAIDLFSGCGGLSLGLERAGFEVRAAVEIDELAAATYKRNHSQTTIIQDDIRNITVKDLKRAAGLGRATLDLLAGCPPCQGFSRIKRKDKSNGDDPRNDFVLDFLGIAKELRPRIVLLENVPGLGKDRRFTRMVRELQHLGYSCDWSILNAADFGVPQRRKRLILVASRLGAISVPSKTGVHKTVRDYIGDLDAPRKTGDVLQKMYSKNTPRIKKLIAKIPQNGGSRDALGRKAQLPCHQRIDGFKDVYGRMKWDDVAPTLTSGCCNPSKGRFLHPVQNRSITLREAALLQTFPRRYRFPAKAGVTAIARMIGDALPPILGKAQGRHIINFLENSRV